MLKILYICTHNRCRSIMSEAISNQDGGPEIQTRSAGSQPAGEVHPLTLKYLKEAGYNVDGLKSESWNEFNSFTPDIVVTVCDSAAQESCPLWLGDALQLNWELADPSSVRGTEEQKKWAFRNTIELIKKRVQLVNEIQHLTPDQFVQKLLGVGARLKTSD